MKLQVHKKQDVIHNLFEPDDSSSSHSEVEDSDSDDSGFSREIINKLDK